MANDISKALSYISAKLDGSKVEDGKVVCEKHSLEIEIKVGQKNEQNNIVILQVLFKVAHPFFDGDLIESATATAPTFENALIQATENFCSSSLQPIVAALSCDYSSAPSIETELYGKKHVFRKACIGSTFSIGALNPQQKSLWELIEDDIKNYLGTKRVYWIKMLVSCTKNNVIAEVRINNIVFPKLTKNLRKYAQTWENHQTFHTEKQFAVLIQDAETFKPYKFTAEKIRDYVLQIIPMFEKVSSKEEFQAMHDRILKLTGDNNLTDELTVFIPEIYSRIIMKIKADDTVLPVMKGEQNPVPYRASQVRSYSYTEDAVFNYIMRTKPEKETVQNMLACSASYATVAKAVKDGSEPKNLILSGIAYFVNPDYEIV